MAANRMPLLNADQVHALENLEEEAGGHAGKFASSAVELLTVSSETMRMHWRGGEFSGLLFNHQLVCEIVLEQFIHEQLRHLDSSGPTAVSEDRHTLEPWLEKTRSDKGQIFEELVNALERICCAHLSSVEDIEKLAPLLNWEDDEVRRSLVQSLFEEIAFSYSEAPARSLATFAHLNSLAKSTGKWIEFALAVIEINQELWTRSDSMELRDKIRTSLFEELRYLRGAGYVTLDSSRAFMKLGVQISESCYYNKNLEDGPRVVEETLGVTRSILASPAIPEDHVQEARYYTSLLQGALGLFSQASSRYEDSLTSYDRAQEGYADLLEDKTFGRAAQLRMAWLDLKRIEVMKALEVPNDDILTRRRACLDSLARAIENAPSHHASNLLYLWALHIATHVPEALERLGVEADELMLELSAAITRLEDQLRQDPWHIELNIGLFQLHSIASKLTASFEESSSHTKRAMELARWLTTYSSTPIEYALQFVRLGRKLTEQLSKREEFDDAVDVSRRAVLFLDSFYEERSEDQRLALELFETCTAFASDKAMFPVQAERLELIERGANAMLPHWESLVEDLNMLRELAWAFNCAGVTHRHLGNRERAKFWLAHDLEASERIVELDDSPKRIVDLVYAQVAYQSVLDEPEERRVLLEDATERMSLLHARSLQVISDKSWEKLCDVFEERALEAGFMSEEELGALGWRKS